MSNCRFAMSPTKREPSLANPTTEGVTRPPSSLITTRGSPLSSTAHTELVVPRSIPMTFAISLPLSQILPGTGLEPALPCGKRLLRPLCLPISPSGRTRLSSPTHPVSSSIPSAHICRSKYLLRIVVQEGLIDEVIFSLSYLLRFLCGSGL